MNVHDIPMAIFTIVSQMAVGTFITLGIIQLVLGRRHDPKVTEHVVAPVTYVVGPVLVLGLAVSVFHVNDVTHILQRRAQLAALVALTRDPVRPRVRRRRVSVSPSSTGSRRAARRSARSLQGHPAARHRPAVVGSDDDYSLEAVPAWHTWVVPFEFIATASLLGVLTVGSAMMLTTAMRTRVAAAHTDGAEAAELLSWHRGRDGGCSRPLPDESAAAAPARGLMAQIRGRIAEINSPTTEQEWQLTTRIMKSVAVVGAIVAVAYDRGLDDLRR